MKVAIVGLRQGHIADFIWRVRTRDDLELVAICEEDATTRAKVSVDYAGVPIFDSFTTMLDEVECDVIGIGDYFGKRGQLAIEALSRGKHVMADKPLCTRLSELDEIERLANENGLSVGCMLDLRDSPAFQALRDVVRDELGRVHSVYFGAQHPLLPETRPRWYFEEDKQGGTIIDIAIHAFDYFPLLAGQAVTRIDAARNWNARVPEEPHFRDAAQVMFTLEDGCGVMGDVSYILPDSFGYAHPFYWRTTVWGDNGVAEINLRATVVTLYKNGSTGPQFIPVGPGAPGGYLDAFLAELNGAPHELTTPKVIESTRLALLAQNAADTGVTASLMLNTV